MIFVFVVVVVLEGQSALCGNCCVSVPISRRVLEMSMTKRSDRKTDRQTDSVRLNRDDGTLIVKTQKLVATQTLQLILTACLRRLGIPIRAKDNAGSSVKTLTATQIIQLLQTSACVILACVALITAHVTLHV